MKIFMSKVRDYKAVGFVLKNDLGGVHSVAIYTVGTNSWKLVGFEGEDYSTWRQCFITKSTEFGRTSVCLNGILYAVARDDHQNLWKLVSFDLSSELFASSALPAENTDLGNHHVMPRSSDLGKLMTVDDSLAIFYLGYRTLWILEKSSSWTPRYNFYTFGPTFLPENVEFENLEDGELLVSGSNGLITINQQTNKEKKKKVVYIDHTWTYVESLLLH